MANLIDDSKYYTCKECGCRQFIREDLHTLLCEEPNPDPNYYSNVIAAEIRTTYRYKCAMCNAPLSRGIEVPIPRQEDKTQ